MYETKINLRRFDEVAPLISPEAVFWFTDGTHRGINAIRAAFEDTWRKLQNEMYWLEDVEWIAVGDTAASCTYRFRWKADIDGKATEKHSRESVVARRPCEGKVLFGRSSTSTLSRFPK